MTGKEIKLQDFAKECRVTDRAIYKHVQGLGDQLQGHVEKRGKSGTWLDEVAVQVIRSRMVTPPAPVIADMTLQDENKRLKDALLAYQDRVIRMQDLIAAQKVQLLEAATVQETLKQEQERADGLQGRVSSLEEDLAASEERAVSAEERAQAAEEALAVERCRKLSFSERFFGRKR